MIVRLNHVGLVVDKIKSYENSLKVLGLEEIATPLADPIQKVSASFWSTGNQNDTAIELLEPADDNSPISRFLATRGAGLHHICLEVADIERMTKQLVSSGFKMVCPPVNCVAYDQSFNRKSELSTRIAFFLLPNCLLIEILEKGG